MKFIVLTVIFVEAQATFTINPVTSLPQAQTCGDKVINLNEGDDWILPLTPIAGSQVCWYHFNIPSNYYALMDLSAFFVGTGEQIHVGDSFGDLDVRFLVNPYISSGAWPSNFSVYIRTNEETRFQLAVNVTLVVASPLDDVTDVVVGVNQAPFLQFYSNWPAGKTYRFKAESGEMAVYPVPYTDNIDIDNALRNIFVYNGSVLIGTLMSIMLPAKCPLKNPQISDLMLYAPVQPLAKGVAMVTDFANIVSISCYIATYVPYNYPMMTYYYLIFANDQTCRESALTIVGDADDSSPIDILSIETIWGNPLGSLSVVSSGPMANHSSGLVISGSDLPIHLTGNIWTLYVSNGAVNVTIHTNSTSN